MVVVTVIPPGCPCLEAIPTHMSPRIFFFLRYRWPRLSVKQQIEDVQRSPKKILMFLVVVEFQELIAFESL